MIDPIALFWLFLWTGIGSYGLYLILSEDKSASCIYVYGKSLETRKRKGLFLQLFLLPKRYFRHFYITAILIFPISIAVIFIYYIPSSLNIKFLNDLEAVSSLIDMASRLTGSIEIDTATSLSSITSLTFTLILMTIQSSRRLYETLFISVYSNNSKINLMHYIFGHLFYVAAALSTVCPVILSSTSEKYTFTMLIDNLITKQRAISFILFIYASHQQQKCHKILANLRKDKSGNVITEQHYVPAGGLFEYVSCPHFLMEVIIYFIILVAQEFKQKYWNLIFLLVISTQTINAINEHRWYKRKYSDLPKERKAIFPKLL